MSHIPVLYDEVLSMFAGLDHPPQNFLDCTFGRGGHLRGVMTQFPEVSAVAIDQDADAIAYGREHFAAEIAAGRLELRHEKFWHTKGGPFDLILADLGVSSPQLDQAERGFSFYQDGPLDMRMDQRDSLTAAEIINHWSEDDLNTLFRSLGEIARPQRVTHAIATARVSRAFTRTAELATLIERTEGWRRRGHHPATNYFLALRLEVNRELSQLDEALTHLISLLNSRGRLAVITFHSLEDRIVKFKLKASPGRLVNKKVIAPKWVQTKSNPRARSAKLRVFEKQGDL